MNNPGCGINRRDVLQIAAITGAGSLLASKPARAELDEDRKLKVVDTNVSLFHWPFRRLPLDETSKLLKKLRSLGVSQAWAGSFEAVLHRDMAGLNQRLASECQQHPELIPIGSVNPLLPGWENDLRRCFDTHGMPAVRVFPNYHGYTLNEPRFAQLLEKVMKAGRFVQLAAVMEDTRTQHPMLRAADVDLEPLAGLLRRLGRVSVQVLNWRPQGPVLEKLAKTPGVYFDTARVDSTDGVPRLVGKVPGDRVMFGSHAPFLVPEAALIRVHESSQLPEASLRVLLSENAGRLLRKARS